MSGDNIIDIVFIVLCNIVVRVLCIIEYRGFIRIFNKVEYLIEIYLVIVKVLGNLLSKSIKVVKKNLVNN